MGLLDPLPQCLVGGQAIGLLERVLNARQHLGREGGRCTWRNVGSEERREGPCLLDGEPVPDGVAADPKQRSHLLPRLGVTGHAQIAHLQADVLATIMLALEALFQVIGTFNT